MPAFGLVSRKPGNAHADGAVYTLPVDRPITHEVSPAQAQRLRALFAARGHALTTNPKNEYIAFEVRTPGRSIFTLYTSGKFVCTARAGDPEGAVLFAELTALLGGAAPAARRAGKADVPGARDGAAGEGAASGAVRGSSDAPAGTRRGIAHGARRGLSWLAGVDETGTGELLGGAVLAGALMPAPLAETVAAVAGHVETKASRAASGWESLGAQLAGLAPQGLHLSSLPIPNRLFDAWSKNGLLDLAYVRLVGDLLAGAGLSRAESLDGLELVVDDYGTGPLLADAVEAWRGRGMHVLVETRADDRHLAARIASVVARAHRSREKTGLDRTVPDGPLGTGNAGHGVTLRWLRRRAAARDHAPGRWPPFVKTSFRTVRSIDGLPEVVKRRLPPLRELLDDESAHDVLRGRLDVSRAVLRGASGTPLRAFSVTARGELREPSPPCLAWDLLPLLCGGIVLDDSVCGPETLETLLEPETGLLAGWRVLVGPQDDESSPAASGAAEVRAARAATLLALAASHAAGQLMAVPTAVSDPLERARRHAAVLLSREARPELLSLRLLD